MRGHSAKWLCRVDVVSGLAAGQARVVNRVITVKHNQYMGSVVIRHDDQHEKSGRITEATAYNQAVCQSACQSASRIRSYKPASHASLSPLA